MQLSMPYLHRISVVTRSELGQSMSGARKWLQSAVCLTACLQYRRIHM